MSDWLALPDDPFRAATLVGLAGFFTFTGVMHFVRPKLFEAIVPPSLPAPATLVSVSGVAELLGAFGLLIGSTRVLAAWGLLALLVAVFPANVFMARHAERFRRVAPAWALWARLPLQPILMAVVAWAAGLAG